DLGYDANRIGKLVARREHRHERAFGEPSVADLAALRAANTPRFAGGVRRHVVMKHEAVAILAHERIDDLLVARSAQGCDDHRLRLTTGKQRRAVRSRKNAGADGDRPHGARVARIDSRLAGQDLVANVLGLELEKEIPDMVYISRIGVRGNAFDLD